MRAVVFVLGVAAAFAIWRLTVPPSPYTVVVPIDRRPPLKIEIVERTRP